MNVKLCVLSVGALFFLGQTAFAQTTKKDTAKTKVIDEIVVVGVQKKKREEITQAVSVVGGDELTRMSASSTGITNMLQGKMSGLQVSTNSGKPGEPGSIRIRGAVNVSATIGASDPLFVVDGVYMTQRQFNSIPASDIESVTELKDAASTAQYGSRASNGVMVITTKRGKSGKPAITYDTRFGFAYKPKDVNFTMMNTAQKIQFENEMSGVGVNPNPVYTPAEAAELMAQDHDWSKDILRNSSIQYHNLSVRGGSDTNSYYASLGYDTDSGILQELDGFKRYSGRFNFDQKVSDKMKLAFDFGVTNVKTQDQRYSYNALSPFYSLYTLNSYEPIYNSNGSFNPTTNSINPVDLRRNEVTTDWRTRLTGQVSGTYEFFKGLTFKSSFGGIYDVRKNKYIVRKGSEIAKVYGTPDGSIRDTRSDYWSYVFNNRLDFTKSFGQHKISAVAMFEYNQEDFGSLSGTKRVMLGPDVTDVGSASTPFAVTGNTTSTRFVSLLGIIDYNYAGRYLLSGSIRRDGNSRLGTNQKYGNFWSASAAWNVAKESFFDVPFFNDIKFRYSIGTTGNVSALLDYQNLISVVSGDYGTDPTSGPSNFVGNNDLKWERKESQNLGVDVVMWNNRIKLTAEVFKDNRKDFLYAIGNTPFTGGGYLMSSVTNAGNIEIKGLESELNVDIIRSKDFDWSVRGNISMLKYNVKSLYGSNTQLSLDGTTFMRVGDEPTIFKMVKSAGVDPTNGDALYYKLDGSVTNVYNSSDAQFLPGKSTLPSAYGGFGTTFRYKGFDLNADFSFQTGGYSYNIMAQNLSDFSAYNQNLSTDAFNYWKKPGDTNVLPKPNVNGLQSTDAFLQKTDFVRLRSVEIGYTFDKKFLGESLPVNSIRVYGSGQNLALWTNYTGDPEIALASETQANGAFIPGSISLYNYPNTRTFLMGVQVNF
ncbi:SusC/RagA family TonB-linked outer membrane protein [Chryseobacterium rhizosphaerae]|uniref:SusC/RagA family TonB-linked outer membrane protein n=1 Tax=Chryseobacterium rhizosphaerae TaxID=395937 RepID=A0ABX9IQ36_9FLAO|nr:SusC/RagA family TonB-linked outer membrane protein [Chryseobacterium rhizosphaerae]MDR6548758.1 TonB-linked SusC/RagA family outer membrane protein [Chryseobacterium rhizosphaerae]REC78166.1 SusC/RagA family TonB-linked outer membrane protein [Chryseobacterium rhizosphaerae]GEN68893.1 SusC/RagA family TonB-linked outer membrane protein [Chryseobacterium rhizosphaerae]